MPKRVVVICPGRGSYNKEELGYLKRKGKSALGLVKKVDAFRKHEKLPLISELDQMKSYSLSKHTPGENASHLIYACAMADLETLSPKEFEIAAITGNSMGWYLALAASQAVSEDAAIRLIHTMGSMGKITEKGIVGGQVIYPIAGPDWQPDPKLHSDVLEKIREIKKLPDAELHLSIRLGGYLVLGGNKTALEELVKTLPPVGGRYPLRLHNHSAFHTPLLEEFSHRAFELIPLQDFTSPKIPIIDGGGKIWSPYSTDPAHLREYTLGRQVTQTYDFSKAIEVSLKEFAPDHLVLLGPGASLGSPIGQILAHLNWRGIDSKSAFQQSQKDEPFLITLGA